MLADDFDFQFYSEDEDIGDHLKRTAEKELRDLAQGHRDLIGAHVSVKKPARASTSFIYEVNIVAYLRPENVDASEKDDTAEGAMKMALKAITRQVRDKRERLGKPWKRVQE